MHQNCAKEAVGWQSGITSHIVRNYFSKTFKLIFASALLQTVFNPISKHYWYWGSETQYIVIIIIIIISWCRPPAARLTPGSTPGLFLTTATVSTSQPTTTVTGVRWASSYEEIGADLLIWDINIISIPLLAIILLVYIYWYLLRRRC